MPDTDTLIDAGDDIPLAIPHFEEQLLVRLHERQQAGAWSAPSRRSSVGFDHGGWWRSPGGRLVGAAAAVALVGGAAAVLVTRDDGAPDLDTAATAPSAQSDAVVDEVVAALGTVIDDGAIVHITNDDGTNEAWVDLRSRAERSIVPATSGGRTMDWGRSEPPALDGERPPIEDPVPRRLVDHCRHEYADQVELDLQMFDVVTPLHDGLAASAYDVSGPVDVDGRSLLVFSPVSAEQTPVSESDIQAARDALEEIQAQVEAEAAGEGAATEQDALEDAQAALEEIQAQVEEAASEATAAEQDALEDAQAALGEIQAQVEEAAGEGAAAEQDALEDAQAALAEIQAQVEEAAGEVTATEQDAQAQEMAAAQADAEAAVRPGEVVYVDPATKLPVHLGQAGSGGGRDIEYLPRTAENLALLVSPIPGGYTKVDEIAPDQSRAAGCVG